MKKRNIILMGTIIFMLLQAPAPLQARVVTVDASVVNVRQGASIETEKISKVSNGQIFGWYGAADNWTKIKLIDGTDGYVRNDLLQGYDELTVTGSVVRIRKSPSLGGEILAKVTKGTTLPVLDHQGGWFKVQLSSGLGWISGDYIKLDKPVVLSSTVEVVDNTNPKPNPNTGSMNNQPESYNTISGNISGKIIVIDPGHGINSNGILDPGATGIVTGNKEKDINLDIALKTKSILEQKGATVIMTHIGETALNLYGRASIADNANADVFVSIHSNASNSPSLSGHSTYFYAPENHSSLGSQRWLRQKLAQSVQSELVKAGGRRDIGILENSFVVIRETKCPSILVETAFLSNAEEDRLLSDGAYRFKLAQGIANGISKYFSVS